MPTSYPCGRFSLITFRAERRSPGSAARFSATVEAVMLATIPAAVRGANFTAGGCEVVPVRLAPNQPREAGDSVWETEHVGRTSLMHRTAAGAEKGFAVLLCICLLMIFDRQAPGGGEVVEKSAGVECFAHSDRASAGKSTVEAKIDTSPCF